VAVRPLENHTSDVEAGGFVASALRRELARWGADAEADAATARIEGTVDDVTTGAATPDGSIQRLVLACSARLVAGEKVLREARVVREESWLAGRDALESEGRRRLALRRAAEGAARELLERFEAR
jgi:hypothetical protein